MRKTRHFNQRMSQRAIREFIVEVACLHGKRDFRNRIILSRKEIDAQLARLNKRKTALLEARKKGGVVVVEQCGSLITTYGIE